MEDIASRAGAELVSRSQGVFTRSSRRNDFSAAQSSQSHKTQQWTRWSCRCHLGLSLCVSVMCALGTISVWIVVQLSCKSMRTGSNSNHAPWLAQPGCLSEGEIETPRWRSTWIPLCHSTSISWVPPVWQALSWALSREQSSSVGEQQAQGGGPQGKHCMHAENRVGLISIRLFLSRV